MKKLDPPIRWLITTPTSMKDAIRKVAQGNMSYFVREALQAALDKGNRKQRRATTPHI